MTPDPDPDDAAPPADSAAAITEALEADEDQDIREGEGRDERR
jgi:hypothetical protein